MLIVPTDVGCNPHQVAAEEVGKEFVAGVLQHYGAEVGGEGLALLGEKDKEAAGKVGKGGGRGVGVGEGCGGSGNDCRPVPGTPSGVREPVKPR